MGEKIRVGVVGLGYMGKKHIECYGRIGQAELVAAADVNAEKIREKGDYPFKLYPSLEEMAAAERLDAVDICLPTYFHCEAVVTALSAGLNVIVEKPFSLRDEEAGRMMAAAAGKKRLMIAHVCRFIPEYQYAKKIAETGELGRPLYYYASRNSATPLWSAGNWLANKKFSGGTLMDLQIHDIDVANWLLGRPEACRMVEVGSEKLAQTNFRHVVSTVKYEGGGVAVLEAGHLMPQVYPFSTAYRLVCENGVVEFSKSTDLHFAKYVEDKAEDLAESYQQNYAGFDPYEAELRHFVDRLLDGGEFAVSQQEARLAVNTVNSLMESRLFTG